MRDWRLVAGGALKENQTKKRVHDVLTVTVCEIAYFLFKHLGPPEKRTEAEKLRVLVSGKICRSLKLNPLTAFIEGGQHV